MKMKMRVEIDGEIVIREILYLNHPVFPDNQIWPQRYAMPVHTSDEKVIWRVGNAVPLIVRF